MLAETTLTPRLAAFTLGGDAPATSYGANALALAGSRGTLVVDPFIAPAHARLLAEALARRGFPPVTHAALTHHHTDHALGAGWFAARGAQVAAHPRCAEAMATQHPALVQARRRDPALAALFADAEPHAPGLRVDGVLELDLGGTRARLIHLGHGHTPGDLTVHFPDEGVAATGDLVFRGYHFNYEEADAPGAAGALEGLAALGATVFVPGHGPAGGAEVLAEQARYHAEARRLVEAGGGEDAVREALVAAFPDHLLPEAAGTAWAAWSVRR